MILRTQIEQQTTFSNKKRKSLINWFNRQTLEIKVHIFKENRNQFFTLKNKYGLSDITSLAALYKAIDIFYNKEKFLSKKNKSTSLDDLKSVTEFSIRKHRKQRLSVKREKLLNLISVIEKLIDENYSLRAASDFLYKVHKLKVSHTYIASILKQVSNA